MKPLVCIIVLNYNGKEVIQTCLSSLIKNTAYSNYKILIVDNGSTDGSPGIIKREFKKVQLIELTENIGFSRGMNAGARHALSEKPEYILFLSNDVSIPNDQKKWLETLVRDLESDPNAAAAGPKSIRPDGSIDETGSYFTNSITGKVKKPVQDNERKQKVHLTTGACILAKTSVLKKIGCYDERFSPFWFEDTDLFARIRKAGYDVIYEPAAVITHIGSHSINKEKKKNSVKVKTIEYKNFIRFAYKHYPFPLFTLAFLNTILSQLIRNPLSVPELLARIDLRKEKTTSA
jgi:GT2 family glycosyltransferase